MDGRTNLQVLAIGKDTTELRQIGSQLSDLGLEIEGEMLVQDETHYPMPPSAPKTARTYDSGIRFRCRATQRSSISPLMR